MTSEEGERIRLYRVRREETFVRVWQYVTLNKETDSKDYLIVEKVIPLVQI